MDHKVIIGKIHSVHVKDFVTYHEDTFYAGEYLNILIGPNGTGKSTIVAAIVLGMGGNPQLLSKSTNIRDFIKNGKESALIQVRIYKNIKKEIITFERHIDNNGRSTWKIDDKRYTEKEYLKIVNEFQIQVDNLCQFLPQDRVQDFAKMNPQEILLNTQKSVCNDDVVNMFAKLKELRHTQLNSKKTIEEHQKNLKFAEQRYDTLKHAVEIIKNRRYLTNKIEVCNIKKNWLECDQLKIEMNNIEDDLCQQEQLTERDRNKYEELKTKVKVIMDDVNKIDKEKQISQNEMKQGLSKLNELKNDIRKLQSDRRLAKSDLESKKNDEIEKLSRFENANAILQAYKQDLMDQRKSCGTVQAQDKQRQYICDELEKIRSERDKFMDRRREINRKLDDECTPNLRSIKMKVEELESIPKRRLNMLQTRFEHAHAAVVWLRENRNLFSGRIYEPMILELNIKDAENAKYLENSVLSRDLIAFTCECTSDHDLMISELCNKKGLRIHIIQSDPADVCQYTAAEPISKYRNYGFYSYVIDMIEGPAPILNYLCKVYNLHKIMVGTDIVDKYADSLPNHCRLFFGGNFKYSIVISMYSNQKSSLREMISARNLFCMNIDLSKLNKLKQELSTITKKSDALKNQRTEIENELVRFDEKRKELIQQKKELDEKLIQLKQCENKVKMQIEKIQRIKNESIDIEEEERKFITLSINICKKIISIQREKLKYLKDCAKYEEYYELNFTKLNIIRQENNEIVQEVERAKEILHNSREILDTIRRKYETYKKNYNGKLNSILKLCNGKSPNDIDFPFKRQYSKLPNSIEEIENEILVLQSKIECMAQEDGNILREFEELNEKIETIKEAIQNAVGSECDLEEQIKILHDKWMTEIKIVLDIINENFIKFMSMMSYSGEIQLSRNNERDYDEYGIKIMVQYRDDSHLQALDRFVQSGGERAVAIAVYTLSLQHITNVPFRCVDEINQGMDIINERKILNMIIDETTQPNKSQFFFVTPKLPKGIKYNDNVEVTVIFSGKYLSSSGVFLHK